MSEHKISFAKRPGAGVTAPVTPSPAAPVNIPAVVNVTAQTMASNPQPVPTPPPPAEEEQPPQQEVVHDANAQIAVPGINSLGFYTGEEEMPETTAADKRTPWLALIQPTTKDKVVDGKLVADGSFVYKKAVVLPKTFRTVTVGFRPKAWVEKLKYNPNPGPNDPKPRVASTLAEVASFGGTDVWKLSNQNRDRNDVPLHATPFFESHIQGLFLIECPPGVDDSHFPHVVDGKAYGFALYEFKGVSFGTGFVPINTERGSSLRGKWCTRFVEFTSRQGTKSPAFFTVTKVTDPTSEALQALIAREIR